MTTAKIMTAVSLVAALSAATLATIRHAHKSPSAAAQPETALRVMPGGERASATRADPGMKTRGPRPTAMLHYEEAAHYESTASDPQAIEEALTKAQEAENRAAEVARARSLDSEVAARPVDAALEQRANDLVASVRRLGVPGMDHLAADAADCGRGACRIRIPSELVEPLRSQFGRSAGDLHLFAFDPKDDFGSAIVYVLPQSPVVTATNP